MGIAHFESESPPPKEVMAKPARAALAVTADIVGLQRVETSSWWKTVKAGMRTAISTMMLTYPRPAASQRGMRAIGSRARAMPRVVPVRPACDPPWPALAA